MSSQQYQMISWYNCKLKISDYKKKYFFLKEFTFKFDMLKDAEYNANSVYYLNRIALIVRVSVWKC